MLIPLLLLLLSSSATTIATHNRRVLHQPFFPEDSPPPSQPPSPQSPTPQNRSSTSTPNQPPFFPSIPSPPPPPPPSASFPANISSLTLPQNPKSNPSSSKLAAVAVALIVLAVFLTAIIVFLYVRRRRRRSFSDTKTSTSDNSHRVFHANAGLPKPRRSPPTSSEFLFLGTVVSSHTRVNSQAARNSGGAGAGDVSLRKLDSPELRPLPPLGQQNLRRNYANANVGSGGEDEDEQFYSPRGSSGCRESSIATGSASRRAFEAVIVENFDVRSSESSSSSSSSNSGSPTRSVSLSISPPVSSTPRSSMPKSPELVAVQTAPPPRPPLPPRPVMTQLANLKSSPSPSPPSSSSPERDSDKSIDSSPRISNVSIQNAESSARISNVSNQIAEFPARISNAVLDKSANKRNSRSPSLSSFSSPEKPPVKTQNSSPRISNVSHPNSASPVRISSTIQRPVVVSVAPPPPPPPPPPPRHWEIPIPTQSIRQPISKPPVLVTPSRRVAVHSPTLISPTELLPNSQNVEKNEETPKPKLKPLHWDKVRASSDREMVWDQLKSSSFKLNEEMIETLFIVNTPDPTLKESTRRQVLPTPKQENRVLDPKKAQNIAISLRALNVTIEEVCEALSEGNADALGTDLLESLLKMAPTKEEERRLKEYKDDSPFKLGPAERFLMAVLDIPFAFKRVDTMLYMANFESEAEYLKKSFDTLEAACEELRSSRMFLKLLEAVLKTGNRMNVGTNRGDAHAFKLDTLLKLVDVKAADGKTTLLHFVVQEIIKSEGARPSGDNQNPKYTSNDDAKCRKLGLQVVSALSSELTNVKKAAAMDSDVLSSDVMKLSKGLENIAEVVRLNEAIMGSEESKQRFSESMNRFMKMAEEQIIRIQAQESVALSLVKEITEYFHGNSAKEEAHPFRIFMVVRDFLTVLDRVCREVGMINERTIISSAHKFPVPVNPAMQGVSEAGAQLTRLDSSSTRSCLWSGKMESSQNPSLKQQVPADEPQLDLYTIPTHSSWFSWDDVHETEKLHLRDFFDGSSITRTPKIYKEYRDFIISKYREDPSRRLTFSEVRKSLVGDIGLLHKVFLFQEKWGLINFGAPATEDDLGEEEESQGRWRVRVEEGAPNGVRVVAVPNSLKPVTVPPSGSDSGGEVVENGFKLAPLASYRDVYSEQKEMLCMNCKDRCESGHYECKKEGSFINCVKCFKNGNYGENRSVDDFKFIDCIPDSGNHAAVWTEAETLLLLESVLKHGDDWDLVAKNVKTKSKVDCISKLIQLPFGDLMLGSTHRSGRLWDNDGNLSSVKQGQIASSESHSQENIRTEDQFHGVKNESKQNGDTENQVPPLKRARTTLPSDTGSSLMKQVALISSMVDPDIAASAAEAAVTALCDENQCTREIFDGDGYGDGDGDEDEELGSSPQNNKKQRVLQVDGSEIEERSTELDSQATSSEKNAIPLTFRMRAATATALGAAAARAKLLADQEDREIECLVATIVETQLKKLQRKIKHFDDLELIMEKEYAQLEDIKESMIVERMNVLHRVFNAGASRWKDQTSVKPPQTGSVL